MPTDAPPTDDRPAGPDSLRAELDGVEARPFPMREDEYRILLEPAARDAILEHANSSPGAELCGVLVGEVYRDEDGPYLVVADAIRGRAAKEDNHAVTFTHSTWEQIHREMDARHPGRRIVGWYHTHPGFGIFLSEPDLFIQRNFFNAAWQVALVIDPKAAQLGLFYWRGGEVVRARRYWVGPEPRWEPAERPAVTTAPGKSARGRPDGPAPGRADAAPAEAREDWLSGPGFLTSALGLLCILLAYMTFSAERTAAFYANELAALRRQTTAESAALARALALRLRDRLDRNDRPAAPAVAFDEVVRLDPENRAAYELLLPEIAPPRPAAPAKAEAAKGPAR